ncbi:hypothetical protein KY334_01155 [Candidatus Woesearchaeota archaeon]|nr:hypothetical protein [Candidatus Woesearchaeota archaeon]
MKKIFIFLVLLILLVNISGCAESSNDSLNSDLEELNNIDSEIEESDLVELEEDLEVIDW